MFLKILASFERVLRLIISFNTSLHVESNLLFKSSWYVKCNENVLGREKNVLPVRVELKALNVEVRKSLVEIIKSRQWRV